MSVDWPIVKAFEYSWGGMHINKFLLARWYKLTERRRAVSRAWASLKVTYATCEPPPSLEGLPQNWSVDGVPRLQSLEATAAYRLPVRDSCKCFLEKWKTDLSSSIFWISPEKEKKSSMSCCVAFGETLVTLTVCISGQHNLNHQLLNKTELQNL